MSRSTRPTNLGLDYNLVYISITEFAGGGGGSVSDLSSCRQNYDKLPPLTKKHSILTTMVYRLSGQILLKNVLF